MKNTNPTTQQDTTQDQLQELLAAWNAHQELHDSGAPLADLWKSREVLDQRRLDACLAA